MSFAELEIRRTPLTPMLHGLYDFIERTIVTENGDVIEALDVLGYGAALTHHLQDSDPTSPGSVFVHDIQKWFDPVGLPCYTGVVVTQSEVRTVDDRHTSDMFLR
ncbi:hypothetical protein [Streptomyces sp. CdTB01]|uniref:hypothetical protein n=1 Tax=Streptomyces sp. CdTB01 TaxID=1725411 RepID=UPI00073AC689|nr:hypothetical protein [Streptomyces sp. CdTB01]ALV34922.1 hypothetical protein AS200_24885 [Streptomyces sp. CdTB01]